MSHEIICEALAECLADNKQSVNDRKYYRAKVVNVTFLRKAAVHYRKAGCVMAFTLTFLLLGEKQFRTQIMINLYAMFMNN